MNSRNKRIMAIIIAIIIMLLIAILGISIYIKGSNTASAVSSGYDSAEKFEEIINPENYGQYEEQSDGLENQIIEPNEEIENEQIDEVIDSNDNDDSVIDERNNNKVKNTVNITNNKTNNTVANAANNKVVATNSNNNNIVNTNNNTVISNNSNVKNEDNNSVINNIRNDLMYTVEYREDSKTGTELLSAKKVENRILGVKYIETAPKIDGYIVDVNTKFVTMTKGENKIIFIYNKRTDLSYKVEYRENNETGTEIADAKIVENRIFGETYEEEAIELEAYNVRSNEKSIQMTIGENKIVFVYDKKPEPEAKLTQIIRDINDGKDITEFIYNPENETNEYMYKFFLENSVEGSYPEKLDNQVVTCTLPYGVSYVEVDDKNIENVTAEQVKDENDREVTKVTWNISDVGYGEDAKFVNIKVKVNVIDASNTQDIFKSLEIDREGQKTVEDVKWDREEIKINTKDSKYSSSIKYYIRKYDYETNTNSYLYVGNGTANFSKTTLTAYASPKTKYSDQTSFIRALAQAMKKPDSKEYKEFLDDFVKANDSTDLSQHIKGEKLPTKQEVNTYLKENYNGTVQIAEDQVILWYQLKEEPNEYDQQEYYTITDSNGETLYESGDTPINVLAGKYRMDGIVVNIKDLGTYLPKGTSKTVASIVEFNGEEQELTMNIFFNEK